MRIRGIRFRCGFMTLRAIAGHGGTRATWVPHRVSSLDAVQQNHDRPMRAGPRNVAQGLMNVGHGPMNAGHGPMNVGHGPLNARAWSDECRAWSDECSAGPPRPAMNLIDNLRPLIPSCPSAPPQGTAALRYVALYSRHSGSIERVQEKDRGWRLFATPGWFFACWRRA